MNIYLDESYNLQKTKGKMFISINGFAVLDDRGLRKRWKIARKSFAQLKRRIHATDSHFENLREKSITLLGRHDVNILSIFQLTQEIPYRLFDQDGIKFDLVYSELLMKLFSSMSLDEYKNVKIVIDSRKHRGGKLGEKIFQYEIERFLKHKYTTTSIVFKLTPSYLDVLIELADFVSNIFYREYHNNSEHVFEKLGFRLIKIKNPL